MRRILVASPAMLVLVLAVVVTTAVLAAPAGTETTVLYDGSLGTLPADQGFNYLAFPAGPTQTITNGGVLLDTTPPGSDSAGYFNELELTPPLNRASGYTVTIEVQVLQETHSSQDRAGFSLIALSDDLTGTLAVEGIELGFWENEIWAQDDDQQGGGLFTHAEGVVFDTTAGLVQYDLVVVTDTYRLLANGVEVLNGRLRDYSSFSGFPDPYETPNFIFLGDDTSAGEARVQINYAAVTVPAGSTPGPQYAIFLPLVRMP